MAELKHPGVKGKVTFAVGGTVAVKEFTIPLKASLDFTSECSIATLKVSQSEFTENLAKLMDWINAFPAELAND